jgi:hypothetical protein
VYSDALAAVLVQAFGCYMHMSVIRLFVESILRYGLPPQFQAAVVKPLPKMEARLRTALAANFGTGALVLPESCCVVVHCAAVAEPALYSCIILLTIASP